MIYRLPLSAPSTPVVHGSTAPKKIPTVPVPRYNGLAFSLNPPTVAVLVTVAHPNVDSPVKTAVERVRVGKVAVVVTVAHQNDENQENE